MENLNQFDWQDFYKELADVLLNFKNKRPQLVELTLKIYEQTGINLPTLEKDNKIVDIDPFTFFGLFNKSSMRESNRISIISTIKELFNIKAQLPSNFASIPVLNNQNATFYYFVGDRADEDIDDLWSLFVNALMYSKEPSDNNFEALSKYFDITINKKGNGNSKITMGLYWIAPDSFLNLDQRNTWYIYQSGKLPLELVESLPQIEAKISSSNYFEIIDKLSDYLQNNSHEIKNFKELSFEAWRYSEEINQEIRRNKSKEQQELMVDSNADENINTVHYWMYSPGDGASKWEEFYDEGIMAIGWDELGNLSTFNNKDEIRESLKKNYDSQKNYIHDAHATWQFANEIKTGDIIFAKKGRSHLVGRGVVTSGYIYNPSRKEYRNVHEVNWTHKGEWELSGQTAMKTLTDISNYTEYVEKINSMFDADTVNDVENAEVVYEKYDKNRFLTQVFMDEDNYDTLVSLIKNKRNVILQGAPGVGKTFIAKRLAYSIMGVKDQHRVMMVQFHQSYSYEDFIMGYRPTNTGFELKEGAFYKFCKEAEVDSEDNPYFVIIDEINRGNLSKIFGELFMLIENDKRGVELQLLYNEEKFSIPKNIHIIGTMNTADRSLAMLDYALRRRFAFFDIKPGFNTKGFNDYQNELNSSAFDSLISCIVELNNKIAGDETLGEGFLIGHSFFSNLKSTSYLDLSNIVEFEIIPLLKEYWFDNHNKLNEWCDKLRESIKK